MKMQLHGADWKLPEMQAITSWPISYYVRKQATVVETRKCLRLLEAAQVANGCPRRNIKSKVLSHGLELTCIPQLLGQLYPCAATAATATQD